MTTESNTSARQQAESVILRGAEALEFLEPVLDEDHFGHGLGLHFLFAAGNSWLDPTSTSRCYIGYLGRVIVRSIRQSDSLVPYNPEALWSFKFR